MSNRPEESPAEALDRFLQRLAIGVFLLGISFALSAANFVASEEVLDIIRPIRKVFGLAVIVIVLPPLLKAFKFKGHVLQKCYEPEGYVVEMFKRACVMAFSLTFVTLIIIERITDAGLIDLPTPFFLRIALSISLDVFALTFFMSTLASDDDEDELEDEA